MARIASMLLLALVATCPAQSDNDPPIEAFFDLSQVAGMEHYSGPEAGKRLLAAQGLLISPETRPQVFTFYQGGRLPYFVTTDTAVHLYGLAVAKCFREIECRQAQRLARFQADLWRAVADGLPPHDDDNGETAPIAWPDEPRAHAATMIAVAQKLLDPDWAPETDAGRSLYKSIAAEVDAELARTARGHVELSPLLGQTGDYSQLAPRGFYAGDDELQGYFRARAFWAMPMNLDDDHALRAALVLAAAEQLQSADESSDFEQHLVGPSCYPSLSTVLHTVWDGGIFGSQGEAARSSELMGLVEGHGLAEARAALREHTDRPLMPTGADLVQVIRENAAPQDQRPLVASLRPRSATPDAVLMARTAWPHVPNLRHPGGLDVAAAIGNDRALQLLLAAEPEANRDPLCQTLALARQRRFGGAWWKAAGDGRLFRQDNRIEDSDADGPQSVFQACDAALWVAVTHLVHALGHPDVDGRHPRFMSTTAYEDKSLGTALAAWASYRHTLALHAAELGYVFGEPESPPGYVEPNLPFWNAITDVALAIHRAAAREGVSAPQLIDLAILCRQAEAIARKQLDGRPLSEDDHDWLEGFGKQMAVLCGYETNVLDDVTDECGFVADIATERQNQRVLHVGAARPRAIYVVIDYGGKLQLARGAVLSYREFHRPLADGRLTDPQWRQMLTAGTDPPPPPWLAALGADYTLDGIVATIKENRFDTGVLDRYASKEILEAMLDLSVAWKKSGKQTFWPPDRPESRLARLISSHPECADREFIERYLTHALEHGWAIDILPPRPELMDLYVALADRWSGDQQRREQRDEMAVVIARTDAPAAAAWLGKHLDAAPIDVQSRLIDSLAGRGGERLPREAAAVVSAWLASALDACTTARADGRPHAADEAPTAGDLVRWAAWMWPHWDFREDGPWHFTKDAVIVYSADRQPLRARVVDAMKRLANCTATDDSLWGEEELVHFARCVGPDILTTGLAERIRRHPEALDLATPPVSGDSRKP